MKTRLLLPIILLIFLFPASRIMGAAPDTTWSVTFKVNMMKAVKDHVFLPDSDEVWMVADQGVAPLKLVPGPGYIYTGTLFNELDSNTTYHYKYYINGTLPESVLRQVTTQPGMVTVSSWWDDMPVNYTNFVVNMEYAVQSGLFNPGSDSVTVIGTMNGWNGSRKMERIGSSLNYTCIYSLDPGTICHYKYRINNGDTALLHLELLNKPDRLVRVPDTIVTVTSDFNNFNPGKRLMTFQCNMKYYITTHRFDESSDFVDIAANFNGGGTNDVLFDTGNDSVLTLGVFIDTSYYSQPLTFRFRINGAAGIVELQGKPDRQYIFHDTVNHHPNEYTCWFNDLDPSIPTPPWVSDVAIQGEFIHKQILTGSYSYENVNGIPEGISLYKWYRSFDAAGDSVVAIDTAWRINYTVDTVDIGKWLVFEVTPRALSGDSATGKTVRVVTPTPIGGVGIDEALSLITRAYPVPARDFITIEARKEIDDLQVTGIDGRKVMEISGIHSPGVRIRLAGLPQGIYVISAFSGTGLKGSVRIIKD